MEGSVILRRAPGAPSLSLGFQTFSALPPFRESRLRPLAYDLLPNRIGPEASLSLENGLKAEKC